MFQLRKPFTDFFFFVISVIKLGVIWGQHNQPPTASLNIWEPLRTLAQVAFKGALLHSRHITVAGYIKVMTWADFKTAHEAARLFVCPQTIYRLHLTQQVELITSPCFTSAFTTPILKICWDLLCWPDPWMIRITLEQRTGGFQRFEAFFFPPLP